MQCKCGGMTTDHTVTENYKIIGLYKKCTCGRIMWVLKPLSK